MPTRRSSFRQDMPSAQLPRSHIFVTLQRGQEARCLALRPWMLYLGVCLFPLSLIVAIASTCAVVFHDDIVATLMDREHSIVAGYEDRIYALRNQIDRTASTRLVEQDSIENRLRDLKLRQSTLEDRTMKVAVLADRLRQIPTETASLRKGARTSQVARANAEAPATDGLQALTPLLHMNGKAVGSSFASSALPESLEAFAPLSPSPLTPAANARPSAKPRPEAVDITPADDAIVPRKPAPRADATQDGKSTSATGGFERQSMLTDTDLLGSLELRRGDAPTAEAPSAVADLSTASIPSQATPQQLRALTASLETTETAQMRSLRTLSDTARQRADRLRIGLAATGLNPASLTTSLKSGADQGGVGGPFVPLKLDPSKSPFERELASLQSDVISADHLTRIVRQIPLGQPLDGDLEITSSFGGRPDPFTGRMAMHTGVDLREEFGGSVMTTAAGRVVAAGPAGGYGNMVEIDHGNGLTTRYGHLSAILVSDDQWVDAGAIIGKAGSTGRSTGTHLHYEVRVDGEAVDPLRFLHAGQKMFAAN